MTEFNDAFHRLATARRQRRLSPSSGSACASASRHAGRLRRRHADRRFAGGRPLSRRVLIVLFSLMGLRR